jgi:DNA repair protein RadB
MSVRRDGSPRSASWSTLRRVPTACNSLDRLLHGGLPRGQITLIYGEAATGKSTISIQSAISCARGGSKVLFLDSDASLHTERLKQIAGSSLYELAPLISISTPKDFFEQTTIIEALESIAKDGLGLMVVDTINNLYRLATVKIDKLFSFNKELNRQLAYLTHFAKVFDLPVILTSQVHSIFRENNLQKDQVEPVATRALNFWSTNIIHLENTLKPSYKTAHLKRWGGRKTSGLFCYFRLTNIGLE